MSRKKLKNGLYIAAAIEALVLIPLLLYAMFFRN
jgi:hypothetical protein